MIGLTGPVQTAPLRPWLLGDPDLPPGRGGTPVTQLAVQLLQRGHRVVLVTLDERMSQRRVWKEGPLTLDIAPFRLRRRARDVFRQERFAIKTALESHEVDLVHAHWTYEYALGALAARKPTLVTMRDWPPTILRYEFDAYHLVRLMMAARVVTRARYMSVTSPYMQVRLQRVTKLPIPIIPNALTSDIFYDQSRTADLIKPTLLAVNARFNRRKNVSRLLEAFQLVRTSIPHAVLILVGNDYGQSGVAARWASRRGLDVGVTFVGPQSHTDVLARMRSADLFVHPALEESFGMVLVEAMAQGTPIVGGRRSGAVPWVLDHGRAGDLVDVSDSKALAHAICESLADPARWKDMSNRGKRHAFDSFNLDSVVDQYIDVYEKIMEGLL